MYNNINESINEYGNIFSDYNEGFPSSLIKSPNYELETFNQFDSIYEDNKLNNIYHIPSYYIINQAKFEKKSISKGTKSTSTKTNNKNEENDEPKLFTSYDILNIFNKESNKDKFSENMKNLKFRKDIEENLQLTGRKRKREDFEDDYDILNQNNELEDDKKMKKRGRQKNNLNRFETHDKMCPDNIIKKVKASVFNFIIYFLNNLLSSADVEYSLENVQLLKLDYKFINRLKKEQEFEFLSMSLKDLFSKDISPKYNLGKYSKDFNKKLIENILNNKSNDTISFAFQMTLRDWLNIFTLKKSVKDIINEYNNINYQNIDSEKIEKSFVGVDKLLNVIKKKNGEDYLTRFILCLYNYERWFYLKKERNNKKKKEL